MGLDAGLNGHEAQSYDFSVDFPERLRRLGEEIGLSSVGIGRRQTALAEKRILLENIAAWADKVGGRLDDVPFEHRRDILKLLLDQVVIDRDNNVLSPWVSLRN